LADPHSGQPGFKHTPAQIEPVTPEWRGFLLTRNADLPVPACLWATRITVPGGALFELAGNGDPTVLERSLPAGERIEAQDRAKGTRRTAVMAEGRLAAVLFITRDGLLPSRDWLISQLGQAALGPALLAGRALSALPDRGTIVCVCFDVGLKTLVNAISEQKLASVAAIGAALGAGTNCGSCRPALARLIATTREKASAASA
jgi:assimilatory nitrate reductase catalytic subunit